MQDTDKKFQSIVNNAIASVDYNKEDFKEIIAQVDDYSSSGDVWFVLSEKETEMFLITAISHREVAIQSSMVQNIQNPMVIDRELLIKMFKNFREKKIGTIKMNHYGGISFNSLGNIEYDKETRMLLKSMIIDLF